MKARWLGVTGSVLVLSALVLGTLGPQLFPSAFWSAAGARTYGAGMPGNGMMGGGMMGGGMMGGGMMGGGMMSGVVAGDASQPFDQRFLEQMIMHHQGAVLSAQMMIADSARPELRDLAQRISTGQQREIDQMRQWRSAWYGSASAATLQEAMQEQMGRTGGMKRDQMRQMMGANADFDRMFLQMMIPHHEAAISMAQQVLALAEHPELETLAQTIITTQQAEIEEMQGYLSTWYGENAN